MSYLTFVGIKGSVGDSARQPGVTRDTDDAEATEQRDDEASNEVGVPNGWGSVEIGAQGAQAASPAPAAAPEGNYPSVASGGEEEAAQDVAQAPTRTATAVPAPDVPEPAAKKAEKAAEPKVPTKKAAPKATVKEKPSAETASEPSAPKPNTYVVTQAPETQSAKVDREEDEHNAWDDLGEFLGFFNPFFAYFPPNLLSEVPGLPFEPFPEIGQTPQPEKFEQIPSVELPEPVQTDTQPEAFAG
ncbi:hypothetical protein [Streptomyces sp. NPDC044948]|uniref:hypothetical protein n=1 Tax=Streptomyces sp. NPDC044948 TaxID=3157092 RepID=UPI0033F41369